MRHRKLLAMVATTSVVTLGLAGCGGGADDSSSESDADLRIAFLSPAAAATYLTSTWSAMEEVAKEEGVSVTQFDAQFDVARQQEQLQNIVVSGKYDGVVISPLTAALSTDVTAAAEAGLKVVVVGNILGDKLDTVEPQVEGVSLSVMAPPTVMGEGLGTLAMKACADKDPCRVVYFYGIKGTPQDTAFFSGFQQAIQSNDAIEIVAEAEGGYEGPDKAMGAMENVLQSTPDFDVAVGADQSMRGAQIALEQANRLDDVSLIGLGGSEVAKIEISAGNWFGGMMMTPRTEGEIALEGLIELLKTGKLSTPAGINPLSHVPNAGIVTQDNVDEAEPQWKG